MPIWGGGAGTGRYCGRRVAGNRLPGSTLYCGVAGAPVGQRRPDRRIT